MERFLRYKANNVETLVKWMGSVADGGQILNVDGEVSEEVVLVLNFQIVTVSEGYMGVLFVETREIKEKDNG